MNRNNKIVIIINIINSLMLFLSAHYLLTIYYFAKEQNLKAFWFGLEVNLPIFIDICFYCAISGLLLSIVLIISEG